MSNIAKHISLSRVSLRVRMRDFQSHKRLAFLDATVCVAGEELFRVRGLALHRSDDGREWISFPGKPGKEDGSFYATIYPVTREVREKLTALAFEELAELTSLAEPSETAVGDEDVPF